MNHKHENNKPQLLLIMGVSGCGKSSIAKTLAEKLNYRYLDADDFHTEQAKTLMAQGKAITDAIRAPWVKSICDHLNTLAVNETHCVLAFSGLKKQHREKFYTLPFQVKGYLLSGSKTLIQQRISARKNHFMPPSLLNSQFAALELPCSIEPIATVDINQTIAAICDTIISQLK
ncbi:gluconokinase [Oceanicoccus sp. KOV_DT_Chl]|uniref:gluconokinase n=1 Tax=Oceanicoccus sp. KOV_DT_Chl TaxID=1904639 RepID=UPI000C796812|nr:gluconokinase, GntK/IdnK-type [Oceanicoccus sp. KOV_DT_Chl]